MSERFDHGGTYRHHHDADTEEPVWWLNCEQFGGEKRHHLHKHGTADPTPAPERPEQDEAVRLAEAVLRFESGHTIEELARRVLATPPPVPAAPELQEAVKAIEETLTGYDWLGTGTSQRAANEDAREAWNHWGTILSALGDSRDPYKRVYKTGGDPRVAVPAAPPALDVERLTDILDEAEGDGIIGPDYTPPRLAAYILARLSPDQKEDGDGR